MDGDFVWLPQHPAVVDDAAAVQEQDVLVVEGDIIRQQGGKDEAQVDEGDLVIFAQQKGGEAAPEGVAEDDKLPAAVGKRVVTRDERADAGEEQVVGIVSFLLRQVVDCGDVGVLVVV